jgi:hypothetical protein
MDRQEQLAYIAGYIDGDGSFYINNRIGIEVTSVNPDIIKFLSEFTNGSFISKKPRKNRENHKPEFVFDIRGYKAINLIKEIYPYLVEKQSEATVLLEALGHVDWASFSKRLKHIKHQENLIDFYDKSFFKSLKNTIQPTELDFSYFAGFIDAECCFRIINSTCKTNTFPNYKILLCCNNSKYPIFPWMVKRFGGNIYFVSRKIKNPKERDQFYWYLSSKALYSILPKIHPFLKYKKPVCEKLIEFYQTSLPNGGDRHSERFKISYATICSKRQSIIQQVKILNKKGL